VCCRLWITPDFDSQTKRLEGCCCRLGFDFRIAAFHVPASLDGSLKQDNRLGSARDDIRFRGRSPTPGRGWWWGWSRKPSPVPLLLRRPQPTHGTPTTLVVLKQSSTAILAALPAGGKVGQRHPPTSTHDPWAFRRRGWVNWIATCSREGNHTTSGGVLWPTLRAQWCARGSVRPLGTHRAQRGAVGDFNNWEWPAHPMQQRAGRIWSCSFPGLAVGTVYNTIVPQPRGHCLSRKPTLWFSA